MSEAIASKAERLAAYNANIAAAEKDPSLSPNTRKPAPKRAAFILDSGLPVSGDSDGSFSAAAMLAL